MLARPAPFGHTRPMTDEELEQIRTRAAERERHLRISAATTSGYAVRKLLGDAHRDVEALLDELDRRGDEGACPFCSSAAVALVRGRYSLTSRERTCGDRS